MNRKLFRGAILEAVLLSLINEAGQNGLHGYAVFLSIQKKFGVRLGASTLYPELAFLERQDLIASCWGIVGGKARKQFKITRKGESLLREYSLELKLVVPAFVTCQR